MQLQCFELAQSQQEGHSSAQLVLYLRALLYVSLNVLILNIGEGTLKQAVTCRKKSVSNF